MPAIYLFQRRTLLAGDDLHLPAIFTIYFRLVQLIAFVSPLLYQLVKDAKQSPDSFIEFVLLDPSQTGSCQRSHFFPLLVLVWLCGHIAYALTSIVTECRISYWSGHGSPTISGVKTRNKHIRQLLESKLLFFTAALIGLISLAIAATAFASRFVQCRSNEVHNQVGDTDDDTDDADDLAFRYTSTSYENYIDWGWHTYWAETRSNDNISSNSDSSLSQAHRIGSTWWWTAFGLLLFGQIMEVLLGLTAASILYTRDSRNPNTINATANSSTVPHNLSSSSEVFYFRQRPQEQSQEQMQELWQNRCHRVFRCLAYSTCFLFGGQDLIGPANGDDNASNRGGARNRGGRYGSGNPYEQVARAVVQLLESGNVLDVTPTDIAAGLLVLQRVQRLGRLQARLDVLQQRNRILLQRGQPVVARPHSFPTAPTPSIFDTSPSHSSSASAGSAVSAPASPTTASSSQRLLRRSSSLGLRSRTPSSNELAAATPSRIDVAPTVPIEDATYQSMQSSPLQKTIYRRRSTQVNQSAVDTLSQPPQSPYRKETRTILNPSANAVDRQVLHEGARYARHALSIYTWKLYVYAHPIVGPFHLIKRCTFCKRKSSPTPSPSLGPHLHTEPQPMAPSSSPDAQTQTLLDHETASISCTVGDNLCQWHKQALLLTVNLDEADLVYARFVNSHLNMPYCIVLDHASESVVLSIRGTLSLEDVVTDTMCDAEPLDPAEFNFDHIMAENPDWPQQYGFSGVVVCVRNVLEDLQRHKWLDRLLLGSNATYPNYTLRLTGHSLGAACAALLSFKLRKEHPDLKVYCYSPPGCTLTWELATFSQDWTTTFVLDSDIVPRISIPSLTALRDDTLQLLGRIKVPKYRVVGAFVMGPTATLLPCKKKSSVPSSLHNDDPHANESGYDHGNDIGHLQDDVQNLSETMTEFLMEEAPSNTIFQRQLEEFLDDQIQVRSRHGSIRNILMHPPGRVVHLIKTGEKQGCCSAVQKCATCCTSNVGSTYTPVWIANDDMNEIVVSPTMMTDHFVDRICYELEKLVENAPDEFECDLQV